MECLVGVFEQGLGLRLLGSWGLMFFLTEVLWLNLYVFMTAGLFPGFSDLKKPFSLKLPLTYSNLVKYIFVKKDETFLPTWFPLRTLSEYSYFRGNIVICLSSLTICSPCNRTQLEILHTLITKALSGISYLKEACIDLHMMRQL